jgi:Tfp pilus assembly protein PilN
LLRGVKDDFEQGFLDDLATAIEAEIASNYMGQAEHLLAEGQRGKFDHVPAAVLAGAVLENSLRTICGQQQQPIAINNSNGDFKTLSPLVDDLKRAGVFNEAKAKQLRAWADIRNLAAHGEFTQFTRSDVEAMISGINNFLADHLI